LIILITYLTALSPIGEASTGTAAGTGRRAAAWFIDFFLSLTALTSILTLIPLAAEAAATGHFAWAFERAHVTATDWLMTLVVIGLAFVGMAFYWTIPVMRRGQTIGQCIAGVRVMPASERAPSPSRVWLRGLLQPFAPLLWMGKLLSGKYWHDEIANMKVVRVLDQPRAGA
jgi:uncharacterized RDD family membrane protein YckC